MISYGYSAVGNWKNPSEERCGYACFGVLHLRSLLDEFSQVGYVCKEVDLSGSAKMKLGLANTLSLDVLAGVLGLGIKAEVGNFNGLYGFMNVFQCNFGCVGVTSVLEVVSKRVILGKFCLLCP
mgnify:CR=1 FL=1